MEEMESSSDISSVVDSMVTQIEESQSANENRHQQTPTTSSQSAFKDLKCEDVFIIPATSGDGATENGKDKVQNEQQIASPVNLSNVFSDSCEIDMTADASQKCDKDEGQDEYQKLGKKSITISVSGVNLNILKKPDSPSSPSSQIYSPEPELLEEPTELVTTSPVTTKCTTDEDTQDVSALIEIKHDVTTAPNQVSLEIEPEEKLSLEKSEKSSSDTENNNEIVQQTSTDFTPHVPPDLRAKPSRGLLKRKATNQDNDQIVKKRRSITFDGVTVFYFPRAQGFTCIPSQGGSTLGMTSQHVFGKKFSLQDYASEQRRLHKHLLLRLKKEQQNTIPNESHEINSSSQSSDEEEESDNQGLTGTDSELDAELDGYYFLQPVSTKQRRLLLREAGVKKIDSEEKKQNSDIRASREFCGCSCKLYCDPETCSCALADIKCQVDRLNFPCGCTKDGCGNHNGRVEFNPLRVRTHFIHTLMRLELEKKHTDKINCDLDVVDQSSSASSSALSIQSVAHHNGMKLAMNSSSSSSHELSYGQCPIQSWNSSSAAQTSSYYNRPDNNLANNYATNLVRDVAFSSGTELESCVNMGSYTNFYNARQHHPVESFEPNNESQLIRPNLQPQQQPVRAEEVFDMYSTFREDSYSENSDEFSNESGDQRLDQRPFAPYNDNTLQPLVSDPNRYGEAYFGMNHHESTLLSYNNVMPHHVSQMIPPNVDEHTSTMTSLSPVPRHHYGSDFGLHVPYVDPSYHYPQAPLDSVALQYSKFGTNNVSTLVSSDQCHTNGFQQHNVVEQEGGIQIQSESNNVDEEESENFGEIIKKSIVDTVA